MYCAHCSKTISRQIDGGGRRTNHFRSCDADVCSWKCAVTRRDEISVFDPHLNSPNEWRYFTAADVESPPRFKRSSSEYSLRTKTNFDYQNSMDILPIILEEKYRFNASDTTFNIALFLTLALSLFWVIC